MSDLTIAASGEVKLDYEVIGQIARLSPTAHLSGAGEWMRVDSAWDHLPAPAEAEPVILRDQLMEMEDDGDRANARAWRPGAVPGEVRAMLEVEK